MCFSSISLHFCCPEIICTASEEASQDSIPVYSSTAIWRIYSCFGSPWPCRPQPPEQCSGLSLGTWHSSASPGKMVWEKSVWFCGLILSFQWKGAALPLVCTVQLLQWSPGMVSSSYFGSHPRFYEFITNHFT